MSSPHQEAYRAMEVHLQKQGSVEPFTLPADAVVQKVIHAMEAKKPSIRYYVTLPAYLFAYLKRILPASWLDYLVRKV